MDNEHKAQSVAILGLGLMGSALADALIAKGFDVTVWNRTPAKAERFAKVARVAASVADAVRASDVLVVCLMDHAATMATLDAATMAVARKGTTLIQLTTMTSAESQALADHAAASGLGYLEGQIMNYPDDVRAGRGIIPCAGPKAVHERVRPVLAALAPKAPLLSESFGAAAIFDKALFEVEFPAYMGFLHGAAMCQAKGVPIETYTALMAHVCFGSGLSERMVLEFGARAAHGRYDDDVKATLDIYMGAFAKTMLEGAALGIETLHLNGVDELLRRACRDGHGSHDFAALFELFARRPG